METLLWRTGYAACLCDSNCNHCSDVDLSGSTFHGWEIIAYAINYILPPDPYVKLPAADL
jgi:hypothetical protein